MAMMAVDKPERLMKAVTKKKHQHAWSRSFFCPICLLVGEKYDQII